MRPYSILFVVNNGLSVKKEEILNFIQYKHFTSTADRDYLNHKLYSYSSCPIKSVLRNFVILDTTHKWTIETRTLSISCPFSFLLTNDWLHLQCLCLWNQ